MSNVQTPGLTSGMRPKYGPGSDSELGRRRRGTRKAAECGGFARALCRTRTGDPFLTMEVLYQLS
jgi:hypothetical protein